MIGMHLASLLRRTQPLPDQPLPPSDDMLRRLSERVLAAVGEGGQLKHPDSWVHRQTVDDIIGGTREWEDLVTPLRQLPPFVWPS